MKKTIFYTITALMIAITACDRKSTDTPAAEQEGVHSEDLHVKHTNQAELSREEHIKLVKAEEVPSFDAVNEKAQANLKVITDQYLKLKEALVASDPQQAGAIAGEMLQNFKAWDGNDLSSEQKDFYQKRSDEIQDNLQQMVDNKDIVKQRDHFARLSKHMTELVSAFGTGKGNLYYQYCPMAFDNKGAYWLSDSKEVRNPFHPEEMLNCGRVAKEL